jgi:hypothetical protein
LDDLARWPAAGRPLPGIPRLGTEPSHSHSLTISRGARPARRVAASVRPRLAAHPDARCRRDSERNLGPGPECRQRREDFRHHRPAGEGRRLGPSLTKSSRRCSNSKAHAQPSLVAGAAAGGPSVRESGGGRIPGPQCPPTVPLARGRSSDRRGSGAGSSPGRRPQMVGDSVCRLLASREPEGGGRSLAPEESDLAAAGRSTWGRPRRGRRPSGSPRPAGGCSGRTSRTSLSPGAGGRRDAPMPGREPPADYRCATSGRRAAPGDGPLGPPTTRERAVVRPACPDRRGCGGISRAPRGRRPCRLTPPDLGRGRWLCKDVASRDVRHGQVARHHRVATPCLTT